MIFFALENYTSTHASLIPPPGKRKEWVCDFEIIACLI